MKFARLTLVLLATFTMAFPVLSAPARHAPVRPSGGSTKAAAAGSWFVCENDPSTTYDCGGSSTYCQAVCEQVCGAPCDWDQNEM